MPADRWSAWELAPFESNCRPHHTRRLPSSHSLRDTNSNGAGDLRHDRVSDSARDQTRTDLDKQRPERRDGIADIPVHRSLCFRNYDNCNHENRNRDNRNHDFRTAVIEQEIFH